MPSIEFELMPEDFVSFNMHAIATSEFGRRQLRNSRIATSALGAFLTAALLIAIGDLIAAPIIAVIVGVILWLWAPRSIRRSMARNLTKSSLSLGVAGAYSLTSEDAGLREHNPSGSSFVEWPSVHAVHETETHVFIYIAPLQAHVVPKQRVQGDLDAFLLAVHKKMPLLSHGGHALG